MNLIDLTGYSLKAKVFWFLMALCAVAGGILAAAEAVYFTANQFALFSVLLTAIFLVGGYEFTIPMLNVRVTGRQFLIFFAAIWLGLTGAFFIGMLGMLIKSPARTGDRRRDLMTIFSVLTSITIAVKASYFILDQAFGVKLLSLSADAVSLQTVAIFLGCVGAINYSLNIVFVYLVKFLIGDQQPEIWRDRFALATVGLIFGVTGAFALHIALINFGVAVAWICLPLLLAGHLTARSHFRNMKRQSSDLLALGDTHLATVEALATAIDARDQLAHGHVKRMQILAGALGEAVGLEPQEVQALRISALLHDIGKLAVPDHILNKPGELTLAEMEKVKVHPTVGAAILETVAFPYPVAPAVRSHHEAWDGTGYPDELRGEDIPLLGRMLAIVDAYDTMRSSRTYGSLSTKEEARKALQNNAGKKFDPKLVDVFLRNLREFEESLDVAGLGYDSDTQVESDRNSGFVDQIKRVNREVFLQYDLTKVFSASMDLDQTLSLFAEKVQSNVQYDTCVVYLYQRSEGDAVAAFVDGKNDSFLKDRRIKPGEGATGYVLQRSEMVTEVDPAMDFMFYYSEIADEYTAMLSMPLLHEGNLIGALSLYSCELETYDREQIKMLETITHIASEAIAKAVYHAETETRALTDPMTGLPNARCLQGQFEKEVARSKRSGNPFQVMMLDLDGFKAVNDTFGHKVGDTLLKDVSRVMRKQLRDYDFLARYAGDEFFAIVPDLNEDGVRDMCRRVEEAVKDYKLKISEDTFASVGVSIGTAAYPHYGETLDQLIVAADGKMYSVKAIHKKRKQNAATVLEAVVESEDPFDSGSFVVELDESAIITNTSSIN